MILESHVLIFDYTMTIRYVGMSVVIDTIYCSLSQYYRLLLLQNDDETMMQNRFPILRRQGTRSRGNLSGNRDTWAITGTDRVSVNVMSTAEFPKILRSVTKLRSEFA